MKKNDIKRVIGKFEPDKGMEYRLSENILKKHKKKFSLRTAVSVVSLAMVICIGILGFSFIIKKSDKFIDKRPDATLNTENSRTAVNIPKTELPKDTNSTIKMDMIGLIVYQGRIYTQTDTKVSVESAENLLDEKLGTTKGNIDEWSKQDDYAVEFASTVGEQDVYSVKGYDKSFRIMTYLKQNGTLHDAQFYECLNGITVKTGADVFDKMKVENNIKAARYEDFESWNYGKQQYKEIANIKALNSFLNELKNTIPYKQESMSYLFESQDESQKFVYVILNDGCQVQLRLFKGGYIHYGFLPVFFKMENEAFNALWNELV